MSVHELVPLITSSHFLSAILLYAGPDQILPLMSVLGGILGVLLVFWQRFVGLVRRVGQFFMSRLRPAAKKKE
jgi:undecaprenyl pyrophosphate phosphatase UppP